MYITMQTLWVWEMRKVYFADKKSLDFCGTCNMTITERWDYMYTCEICWRFWYTHFSGKLSEKTIKYIGESNKED